MRLENFDAIIDALWDVAEPSVYITKEDFASNLRSWDADVTDLGEGGTLIVLTRGPELHFQTLGPKRPISRKIVKEKLQAVIDKHGYCTTKTPLEDVRQHRFNLLIGFVSTSKDAYDRHYRIERVR